MYILWLGLLPNITFSTNEITTYEGSTTINGNVTRVSVNLTISSASREDTGEYTCCASNFIGSDSVNISVTVQCKLHIIV